MRKLHGPQSRNASLVSSLMVVLLLSLTCYSCHAAAATAQADKPRFVTVRQQQSPFQRPQQPSFPVMPPQARPTRSSRSSNINTADRRDSTPIYDELSSEEDEDETQKREVGSTVAPPPWALMRDSRIGFIRKVYLSLTLQLSFTAVAVVLATQHKATLMPWLMSNKRNADAVMFGGLGVALTSLMALGSRAFGGRTGPTIALLAAFTLGESAMVALLTMFFKARSVYVALAQTAVATAGLTAYAYQTNPKYDLTGVGSALASGLMVLLSFGLLRVIFPGTFAGTELLYSSLGAGLFALFIVYDTQRVLGGSHRTSDQIDRKDWALGSVAIYTDILQLFLHLLQIFGERD